MVYSSPGCVHQLPPRARPAVQVVALGLRTSHRIGIALAVSLACCAPGAEASYAQMTLPGLAADLLFVLIAAWTILVDIVLLCRGFRSKLSVIIATLIALTLVSALVAERESVAEALEYASWDWEEKLIAVSLLLVPLTILAAPVAQHLELHRQRPRRAVWLVLAVHAGLIGTGGVMMYLQEHPLESTRAEWRALAERGEAVQPGELAALQDAFERQHRWGTTESLQLLKGVDKSALIHGGEPLSSDDRTALTEMLQRDRAATRLMGAGAHWYGFIEAKLLWDTLQPGSVDRSIPPGAALSEEYLLPFIDQHGPQRLCSADGLADTDRAALMRALAGYRGSQVEARVTTSLDRLSEACRRPQP